MKPTKDIYLQQFNASINGPLHEQSWVHEEMNKFNKAVFLYDSWMTSGENIFKIEFFCKNKNIAGVKKSWN